MKNQISRRHFIKTTAIGGAGLISTFQLSKALALESSAYQSELYLLSEALVKQWLTGLMELQVMDQSRTDDYGGIWCPADKAVHGRCGDSIYPLMYMADKTKDQKYADRAVLLFRWMERRVSQPDGSWLNEPVKGSWQGTTVFSTIALAESVIHHGSMMDAGFKNEITARLQKAGEYIFKNFSLEYGNINYPVSATYALSLLGTLLNEPKFTARGKELAHEALNYISPKDDFLTGEGDHHDHPSKKGCYSVDLGYNVEESLPALVLYGQHTNDQVVLEAVNRLMKTHLEFMLPDGGWDNSWGTRNFKWTYWGSRTSDGCQTAYTLMSTHNPAYYKAALMNAKLWQQCTHGNLLTGGPHFNSHQVAPCVHHTFSHIKALVAVLDKGKPYVKVSLAGVLLPREQVYGSRFYADIQTWLISVGKFRGTVTGYDRDYKNTKNGHPSGGALSMLWHQKTGPILSGSMNEYQIFEAGNQQTDTDPLSMPLTPRVELRIDKSTFMNISDLSAIVEVAGDALKTTVRTKSKLVDKNQQSPASGDVNCMVDYIFTPNKVQLRFSYDNKAYDGQVKFIIPVISQADEKVNMLSVSEVRILKPEGAVHIAANHPIVQLPTTGTRVFNFVPGFEAVPLAIEVNNAVVDITVV